MKTLLRILAAAVVLGGSPFLGGCSSQTARRSPAKVVEEFSIVESSTTRELTALQIDQLRRSVINYLQSEGLPNNRIYYVRVTFPSANPGDEPEWAVVRIGNLPSQTFTVLAAYPGADDYYPFDLLRGYHGRPASFTHWGYYDLFDYNYGHYSGPSAPPPGRDKPDYRPGDKPRPPAGTPTRWNHPPRHQPDDGRHDHPPRGTPRERWNRERDDDGGRRSRPDPVNGESGGRRYTPPDRSSHPPSERSYSPPPERSSPPPAPPPPPPEPVRSEPPAREERSFNNPINQN